MKQLRCGPLGLFGLGFGLFVSGCDFSNNGLGASPAVDRSDASGGAGRGGSPGGSTGSAATGGSTSPDPTPPLDAGAADSSAPPVDAADDNAPAGDDGGSGIKTVDAAPAVDTTPPPPPAATVCPSDTALLLCLDFEGAVTDQSEPAASVSVRGVSFESGPSGQAGRLNAGSQIALPSGVGLGSGAFTVEAWVRPDALPSGMQRAAILDRDGHFGLFLLPGGDVVCYAQAAMAVASGAARAGQWMSVGCSAGGGTVGVWINGVRRGTAPQAGGTPPGGAAIAVGSNSPSGDPFNGLMDNVRVWAGVRDAAQICPLAYDCN